MQNEKETQPVGEGIVTFIQRHRKGIFFCVGLLALTLVICFMALSLRDVFNNKAISAVEDLGSRFEALRSSITEASGTEASGTEEDSADDVAGLIADLESFAKKNSGYAGSKAWSMIGEIRSERKEWDEAETAWAAAAKAGPRTYLAPLAWFNAAIAAEEQGRTEEAIDYYAKSIAAPAGFPAAPRAQFSIGRLQESLNETDAAIEAYRAVISSWPHDTVWVNLAHSRIITLETGSIIILETE
jgi:tetratricopeptide (TPR) repeat protein